MRAVAALPADAVIYSNGPDVIAYVLKRRAHSIPRRFDLRTELDDPTYPFQQQLAQLRRDLDNGNTFIVFWDQIDFRFYLISEGDLQRRSEEHTSELQSLMRISYAVFCLKKKDQIRHIIKHSKYRQDCYTYQDCNNKNKMT